ncbi:MAG: amino acid permease [Proteobacteria bacterium]|nr:amino acid permease [Pseudomonadota bacterium]
MPAGETEPKGFGTFKGVYLPSILTILGVIMYLRMGWVVGNVGLYSTLLIVTISTAITFLTGLSIASTATNMKVKGGGAYFMISRSFGVEAGAAVGIPLFFAQSIGASFYIVGFAESLQRLFPQLSMVITGIICLVFLTFLAYISADIALKTQVFIFIIVVLSLFSLFMGGPPEGGFESSNIQVPEKASFWLVFAVFFPAVTGILSGLSMSGDLKDPARSLPLGTIAAIVSGYIIYMAIPVFLFMNVPAEVLLSDTMVMKELAVIGELIVLGIWGATLSSAIGSLLGAPRTLQALARDRVVPSFLGAGSGNSDNPRIATAFSFLVALTAIIMGDLNALAPVLTMFFLTSYGVLNLIAGIEGLMSNPSWRPTFKTPWPLSIAGAGLCLAAMFMINAGATFIAALVVGLIFYLMIKRDLNARWPDMRRSILLGLARYSIYSLQDTGADPRTWRPNILVLSGAPTQRFYLIELADAISHGKNFLTVAAILAEKDVSEYHIENMRDSIRSFLTKRNIRSLIKITRSDSVLKGAGELVENYGIGPLAPNTFLFGQTEHKKSFQDFAGLIMHIYRSKRNTIIAREAETSDPLKKRKKICLWWGGLRENAGLMLAIGHLMQMSDEWKESSLHLKMIVKEAGDSPNAHRQLEKYLKEGRLNIDVDILVKETEHPDYMTSIRNASGACDLVIMGMKPPEEDDSAEDYARYYAGLLKDTEGLPPTLLILAAEDIKFSDIFI